MLAATIVAFGVAFLVGKTLGADASNLRFALVALALGSFATFVPAVLAISKETWGVAVLVAGMARALIALGYCFALKETDPAVLPRPLFLAVASAAMFLLVVEVVVSIRILSSIERQRLTTREPSTPDTLTRNHA